MAELASDAGFGDRVVWTGSDERGDMAFHCIDAVGADQQKPVEGSALAVFLVGVLADGAGNPFRRCRGAEHRCQEYVLDRTLPWPLLQLPFREVPMCTGCRRVVLKLRYRWPIAWIEIGAPPGDSSA